MAGRRVSPPRRATQQAATSQQEGSDRLAIPMYHTVDPLLGNLSPESTLQALSSTDAVPKNEQAAHDILSKSISQATPTERALGIRAAVATQKLGQWYREVQAWEWPKRTDVHLGKWFVPPSDGDTHSVYCGSLPISVVEEHEKRIEEIREGMDSLDVEELKEYVLNAHIPARSRPSSSHSTMSVPPPLSYVQLSDFTAVITALILRALPLLSRLSSLLSTWSVRLLVLRQIPGLLLSLQFARREINSALDLLKSSDPPTEHDVLYSTTNYHAKRVVLESTVLAAGRRMDRILDALEGREDSLPESWIDDLESIEADFGTWVMHAEKRTVENDWRRLSRKNEKPQPTLARAESAEIHDTASTQPVNSSPSESPDPTSSVAITSPPELAQPRLTSLQIGRTPPMETIVEELGSPSEPAPSRAGNDVDISPILEATTLPLKSPSPLPDQHTEMRGLPTSAPEPLPQARPVLLHGQLPSMETIVEKVGSPSKPPPSAATLPGIATMTEASTTPVVSQTQLPSQALETHEPSGPALCARTDPACTSTALAKMSHGKVEVEMDARLPSIGASLVEESSPLSKRSHGVSCPVVSGTESPMDVKTEGVTSRSTDTSSEKKDLQESQPITGSDIRPEIPAQYAQLSQASESPVKTSPSEEHPQASLGPQADAAGQSPTVFEDDTLESTCYPENDVPPPADIESFKIGEDPNPIVEVGDHPRPLRTEREHVLPTSAAIESASPGPRCPNPPRRCVTPPDHSSILVLQSPNLFVPLNSSRMSSESPQPEVTESQNEGVTPKKPLESPIKLSKTRPRRLDLDNCHSVRRPSNASDGSLSDYPSLVSSPGIRAPRTSSSNGTPLILETPPHFSRDHQSSESVPQNNDHTLREDRLMHLDTQKSSPRDVFTHNRTLSLPLQRFINERLDMNYEQGSGAEEDSPTAEASLDGKRSPAVRRRKARSSTPTSNMRHLPGQNRALNHEKNPEPDSDAFNEVRNETLKLNGNAFSSNAAQKVSQAEPPTRVTAVRLKKQLTAHPSLESIGAYKSTNAVPGKTNSRSSTPNSHLLRPKDQMDEKINSILTTLPAHIHLVAADQDDDAASLASSVPFKNERFPSGSPQGTPLRSNTPTPSLTLRPAVRRRRHSHAPEESSVKLYHLHGGGKSRPTKLFVRTVGENGERVMVRVGGGWADLREYLREYAIHHGRRHVSETPRVEVEGLSPRESPSYSPPGSRLPSGTGCHIPSRPRSVISNRPSSSLAVRKTRRASNVSDIGDFRVTSASEALNAPFSIASRRLSVSSNVSMGAVSSFSENRHGSPSTLGPGASKAIPLGLAGPRPRAKHIAISPESEAWVEDVLGQARRSSLRSLRHGNEPDRTVPTLPKSRSISDLGKAGSSRRVALRGLR